MKRYYFSHQTSDRHEGKVVAEELRSALNIDLVNPFYDRHNVPTREIEALDQGIKLEEIGVSSAEIVGVDERKVRTADGVIAYLSKDCFTFGCPVEMYIAHMIGKPVYTICPILKIRKHPFVRHYSWEIFQSVDDFVDWYMINIKGTQRV